MTRTEAIAEACSIVGLAYHALAAKDSAGTGSSDCFCESSRLPDDSYYCNDGHALAFVREAVVEKLKSEGLIP